MDSKHDVIFSSLRKKIRKLRQNIGAEDLVAWSKEQMAAYKYPRIIEMREALPMTATGKILKKELKAESVG